jgi:hypothetical protein
MLAVRFSTQSAFNEKDRGDPNRLSVAKMDSIPGLSRGALSCIYRPLGPIPKAA